jgi:hypothetical protein
MQIRNVPPERILNIVSAIGFGFDVFDKVCEFVFDAEYSKIPNGDKNHISRALATAEQLDIIELNGQSIKNSTYRLQNIGKFNPKKWTEEERIAFFRERIQAFEPFLMYYDFASHGFSHDSCALKTSSMLKIKPVLSGKNNVFFKWGVFSNIFDDEGKIWLRYLSQKILCYQNSWNYLMMILNVELFYQNG